MALSSLVGADYPKSSIGLSECPEYPHPQEWPVQRSNELSTNSLYLNYPEQLGKVGQCVSSSSLDSETQQQGKLDMPEDHKQHREESRLAVASPAQLEGDESSLTPMDVRYVKFAETFEARFVTQGPDENRPDGGSGHSDVNSIDWTKDDRFINLSS